MEALIFDIKRFAIHDGPGIRTTIFFKGCPLSCPWCHNPESRYPYPQDYIQTNYIGNKKFCSTRKAGKNYSVDELLDESLIDQPFHLESGGGITCSGGEPLEQLPFLLEFLHRCKEVGLHTAIDTSGYAKWEDFEKIVSFTDLFLFDIKLMNENLHKKYTGVSNLIILSNLKKLVENGSEVSLRIPLIPGINMNESFFNDLLEFIIPFRNFNFQNIQLLPYHGTGKSKYKKFNMDGLSDFQEPDSAEILKIRDILSESHFTVTIGG